jgi:hypothetical protein
MIDSATITTDGKTIIRARIMSSDASELAHMIPGATEWRGQGRDSGKEVIRWLYPLSLKTCRAFREVFGENLVILPALEKWAREAVDKEQGKRLKPRRCRRCNRMLTKGRLLQNKMFCGPCAQLNKKASKERAHDRYVGDEYGLEPGEYALLLEAQGGRCAVKTCRANGTSKRLAVEHNHRLGKTREAVRGLMCGLHNDWIGLAGDNPEVFESIAEYLRNPPARRVLGTERTIMED